jgi:hypothetical protein
MTLILLILVGIPILWLLGLIYYLLSWLDWAKERAYVSK